VTRPVPRRVVTQRNIPGILSPAAPASSAPPPVVVLGSGVALPRDVRAASPPEAYGLGQNTQQIHSGGATMYWLGSDEPIEVVLI
jgi:hypothetical protein